MIFMRYLLDSDIVIDVLGKHGQSLQLLEEIAGDEIFLSVIGFSEVLYGIQRGQRSAKDMDAMQNLVRDFHIQILSVTMQVVERYVELKVDLEKKGLKLADFDLLIASTAREHKLILVTRNKRHFSRIPNLKLL